MRANWDGWLGDLALVLNHKGTEFVRGMFETIRVGTPRTPEWAFARSRGHRELGCVRIVRPGHVRPRDYATFVSGFGELDELELDAPEIGDELAKLDRLPCVTLLRYGHQSVRVRYRYEFPPLDQTFRQLAKLFPDVKTVEFATMEWPVGVNAQVRELVGRLKDYFPGLIG